MSQMTQLLNGLMEKKGPHGYYWIRERSSPVNFQVGSGSNPRDDPVIPDLDIIEKEWRNVESSRQLEDRCRWLEEKFKALKNTDHHHDIDAKNLSLVTDLDSLVGEASRWYNQLSRADISSRIDLAKAFMKQYNHVTDMTPERIVLQNMEKKPNESFRQYA
ncbi:CAP-Gly domain-containing linker protein 1-like [Gossypium australe]|uniref:CAP-Gly domain-containing linker protein 1-like n=1 Tax=Gossypium australe TaxID=47621 RepID=A0A5B6V747_9ROSI|nr:CAP-Gly domain-containing linker protein 1-like [Gossypium australe]